MAQVKAMVTMQGGTNLAEDRFINVFHFDQAGVAYETHIASIHTALTAFYDVVGTYISEFVLPAAEIRYYDMSVPEHSRVPTITALPLAIQTTVNSLPNEVAVCMSFRGELPSQPRRRGRVYLGPLNINVYSGALVSSAAPPRPNVGSTFAPLGGNLIDAAVGWCVYSPTTALTDPGAAFVPIVAGWVDDEFDTMRSRGNKSTTRSVFQAT